MAPAQDAPGQQQDGAKDGHGHQAAQRIVRDARTIKAGDDDQCNG